MVELETSGEGNMSFIWWRIQRVRRVSSFMLVHCIIAIKLPMYTSNRCRRAVSLSNSLCGMLVQSMFSTVFLSGCGANSCLLQ